MISLAQFSRLYPRGIENMYKNLAGNGMIYDLTVYITFGIYRSYREQAVIKFDNMDNSYVIAETFVNNCSSIFINDINNVSEDAFIAMFGCSYFTVAISPFNLYGKCTQLSNGLYVYKFYQPAACSTIYDKFKGIDFDKDILEKHLEIIQCDGLSGNDLIFRSYMVAEIFDDYRFIYNFGGYSSMRRYNKGFLVAHRSFEFNNYKPEYYYRAIRTLSELSIFVEKKK